MLEMIIRIIAEQRSPIIVRSVLFAVVYLGAIVSSASQVLVREGEPLAALVTVNFGSKKVADDWAYFADAVVKAGIIPLSQVPPDGHTNLCEIYKQEVSLPGCSDAVARLASGLNPEFYSGKQKSKVLVPNLKLQRYGGKPALTKLPDSLLDLKPKHGEKLKLTNDSKTDPEFRYKAVFEVPASVSEHTLRTIWETIYPTPAPGSTRPWSDATLTFQDYRSLSKTPLHAATIKPVDRWTACRRPEGAGRTHLGSYDLLVSSMDSTRYCSCTGKPGCPLVILMDGKVYMHPNLGTAVRRDVLGKPLDAVEETDDDRVDPNRPEEYCEAVNDFNPKDHHSTHLAGIVTSSNTGKKAHFIGMAPGVPIIAVNWGGVNEGAHEAVSQILALNHSLDQTLIWLFASRFPYSELEKPLLMSSDYYRLKQPLAVQALLRSKSSSLLVAAVGQPLPGEDRVDIVKRSDFSPMNVGDQDNVVIVTACENCDGPNPKIWEEAHSSEGQRLVSVAAPGSLPVPSTATATRFALAGGTSVAAAYVAGLASAMTCRFRETYGKDPAKLKLWLQLTANPIGEEADTRVATGVVNPRLAVHCDPSKMWLRKMLPHPNEKECGREIKQILWCARSEHVERKDDLDADTDTVNSARIYRIYNLKQRKQPNRWVYYINTQTRVSSESSPYSLSKLGPFIPTAKYRERAIAKVIYGDGPTEQLLLNDIYDLILGRRVDYRASTKCE